MWVLHAIGFEESLRRHRLAHQRSWESGVHRDVPLADQLQHRERVGRCCVERRIAEHGGNADQVDLGVQRGEHQRYGVIGPRVAVNDQAVLVGHGGIVGAGARCCGA